MEPSKPRAALLAETDWLAEKLTDPSIRIVDIRGIIKPVDAPHPHYFGNRNAYLEGHIPWAVFVDWTADITEPGAPVKMTVAGPERFAALMGRLGIGDQHTVVGYEDGAGQLAARLWWALNYYGHPAVKVLNGGFQKWIAGGRPVTVDIPHFSPATFKPPVHRQSQGPPGVKVPNGGFQKWIAEGRPVTVDIPLSAPATFKPQVQREWRASPADV